MVITIQKYTQLSNTVMFQKRFRYHIIIENTLLRQYIVIGLLHIMMKIEILKEYGAISASFSNIIERMIMMQITLNI